ncbi:hypothetical protein [Streptomyces galbus]|uniref:Cytochrome c-552/4 domain-containing protein n=1 Tax=Streptomyces galbus TaxID=33898 RepID=A0ABX1IP78_STRGB|nr:hypothetical protein [Streptomyces galbus]NKQ27433.1 hypothetical protein [Streptomyces galbus]
MVILGLLVTGLFFPHDVQKHCQAGIDDDDKSQEDPSPGISGSYQEDAEQNSYNGKTCGDCHVTLYDRALFQAPADARHVISFSPT